MATFLRTSTFDAWLKALRDPVAVARIVVRIREAKAILATLGTTP